jgi:hypothetical protein
MLDCRAQDHEIKAHALYAIGCVKALLASIGNLGATAAPRITEDGLKTLAWSQPAPQAMRLHATTTESMAQDLDKIAKECNAKPCQPNIALAGRIARMCNPAWWLHNLRRETVKANETIQHEAGDIRRKSECYATNHAVKIKAARATANRLTLEGLEVVNEAGIAINLQEVADGSVSNPTIRRGELMVRARGFEETAELHDHSAYFLTLTCPSRFHRFAASGQSNRAWDGDTPRDAQDYLCSVWAKIRAAWSRKKMMPYGFRVAEPHHDGCPHWHILLFMPKEQAGWFDADRFIAGRKDAGAGAVGIAGRYALKDTAAERGANKHRFTCVQIDTTKGSATGYIAKYISKNIDGLKEDGSGMGLDFASGTNAATSAQRVKTWASTWGIRQFQQVGGPSVSVYRELRRLGAVTDANRAQGDLFAPCQDAADNAAWAVYWEQQGGPTVPRRLLTLSPAYTTDKVNKYGEAVSRIMGVAYSSATAQASLQTRLNTWTVQVAGLAEVNAMQAEHRAELATAAAVQRFYRAAGLSGHSEFLALGASCAPWTGVNNCTDTTEKLAFEGFDFSGFEPEDGEIPCSPEYLRRGDPVTVAEEVAFLEDEQWTNEQNWKHQRNYVSLRQS